MDPISWALLLAIVIALLAMLLPRWRWRWGSRSAGRGWFTARPNLSAVLSHVGPQRCIAAVDCLRRLSDSSDSEAIRLAWQQLEGPLLEALPDCPPALKPRLAEALAECANQCANRETAQGMMVLRNSLAEAPHA
jgi:hypothetical protein